MSYLISTCVRTHAGKCAMHTGKWLGPQIFGGLKLSGSDKVKQEREKISCSISLAMKAKIPSTPGIYVFQLIKCYQDNESFVLNC
jgi:hypothetical protein